MRANSKLLHLLIFFICLLSLQCKPDSRLLEVKHKLDAQKFDEIDFETELEYCLNLLERSPSNQDAIITISELYSKGCSQEWSNDGLWATIDYLEKYDFKAVNEKRTSYYEFLPTIDMLEERGLKEGDSIKLDCWINQKVRIRALSSDN